MAVPLDDCGKPQINSHFVRAFAHEAGKLSPRKCHAHLARDSRAGRPCHFKSLPFCDTSCTSLKSAVADSNPVWLSRLHHGSRHSCDGTPVG
jgi:hypothetical protein